MTSGHLAVIVLAAGKGTRMKSDLPKVMHRIANKSMIRHVLDTAARLDAKRAVVVLAPGMDAVAAEARPADIAIQSPALGTGHAVAVTRDVLAPHLAPKGDISEVLVLYGDVPLLTAQTLQRLLDERRRHDAAVVVLGMRPADPGAYGRLVVGVGGMLEAIVEAKDATEAQRAIGLCNAGIMALDGQHLFDLVGGLTTDNAQGEYYLTDIIGLARKQGLACRVVEAPEEETAGVNSRVDLAAAEAILQRRLRHAAMVGGATLTDPGSVFLSADTVIGRDVTIGPFVVCGPGVTIEDGAEINAFTHLVGAHVGRKAIVGPYARLRPGAELGPDVHVGNFVEIKQAKLAAGAKANHLTYIGDADVGAKANIGAGTITCNYDGFFKERTVIGAGAFIGSNTCLVAPVTVGAGAITGAGSVITRNVAADALAVERASQVEKPGAAAAFRERKTREKAARAKPAAE